MQFQLLVCSQIFTLSQFRRALFDESFFLSKSFFFVHILRVMTCFIFRNVYVVFEVLIAISKNISLVTVKVNCAAFHERVIFNFILCLKRL